MKRLYDEFHEKISLGITALNASAQGLTQTMLNLQRDAASEYTVAYAIHEKKTQDFNTLIQEGAAEDLQERQERNQDLDRETHEQLEDCYAMDPENVTPMSEATLVPASVQSVHAYVTERAASSEAWMNLLQRVRQATSRLDERVSEQRRTRLPAPAIRCAAVLPYDLQEEGAPSTVAGSCGTHAAMHQPLSKQFQDLRPAAAQLPELQQLGEGSKDEVIEVIIEIKDEVVLPVGAARELISRAPNGPSPSFFASNLSRALGWLLIIPGSAALLGSATLVAAKYGLLHYALLSHLLVLHVWGASLAVVGAAIGGGVLLLGCMLHQLAFCCTADQRMSPLAPAGPPSPSGGIRACGGGAMSVQGGLGSCTSTYDVEGPGPGLGLGGDGDGSIV